MASRHGNQPTQKRNTRRMDRPPSSPSQPAVRRPFMRPISAVRAVPARPANSSAVTTGPSSRTRLSATSRPSASEDSWRCSVQPLQTQHKADEQWPDTPMMAIDRLPRKKIVAHQPKTGASATATAAPAPGKTAGRPPQISQLAAQWKTHCGQCRSAPAGQIQHARPYRPGNRRPAWAQGNGNAPALAWPARTAAPAPECRTSSAAPAMRHWPEMTGRQCGRFSSRATR